MIFNNKTAVQGAFKMRIQILLLSLYIVYEKVLTMHFISLQSHASVNGLTNTNRENLR